MQWCHHDFKWFQLWQVTVKPAQSWIVHQILSNFSDGSISMVLQLIYGYSVFKTEASGACVLTLNMQHCRYQSHPSREGHDNFKVVNDGIRIVALWPVAMFHHQIQVEKQEFQQLCKMLKRCDDLSKFCFCSTRSSFICDFGWNLFTSYIVIHPVKNEQFFMMQNVLLQY